MTVELQVTFRGGVPGVAEGQLSLAAFAGALTQLLTAYRGTASGILANADGTSYGGHRLRDEAYELDLVLVRQEKACLQLTFESKQAQPEVGQTALIQDLAQRTVRQFLRHLRDEANGREANRFIRRYLETLPKLESQTYSGSIDGQVVDSVDIGDIQIAASPREMPRVDTIRGRVIAVRFEAGSESVTIADEERGQLRMDANARLVEDAIAVRGKDAIAMVVRTAERRRLLWIREAGEWQPLGPEERKTKLLSKWRGLLDRLA